MYDVVEWPVVIPVFAEYLQSQLLKPPCASYLREITHQGMLCIDIHSYRDEGCATECHLWY